MRLAVVFSGQGAQRLRHYEEIKETKTQRIFSAALDDFPLITASTEQHLQLNRYAQPLITSVQLLRWQRLQPLLPEPVIIAGYSAGESASYAAAGVWSIDNALGIASKRAALMDEAINHLGACTMVHVEYGANSQILETLKEYHLWPAIHLGAGRVIVGGLQESFNACRDTLLKQHCTLTELPISIPSHTPLLESVAKPLTDYLHTLECRPPRYPLLCGGAGQVLSRVSDCLDAFVYQTYHTLNWHQCLAILTEYQPDVVLEMGPGNALTRMMREHTETVMARSVDEFQDDGAILEWLERWGG